jgi:hypothetical protein
MDIEITKRARTSSAGEEIGDRCVAPFSGVAHRQEIAAELVLR